MEYPVSYLNALEELWSSLALAGELLTVVD
jgi:hypothetical protein